jgi:hypothetical protein
MARSQLIIIPAIIARIRRTAKLPVVSHEKNETVTGSIFCKMKIITTAPKIIPMINNI